MGEIRREAVALTAGFSSDLVKYSGGAEYRKDSTLNESRKSWLLRNSITYKVNEDGRWVGKLNWADSDSTAGSLAAAKYTEAVWGYAYRPVFNDRLNLLLKYTYLFDLSSPGQSSFTDTTTQPVSTLGVDYQQKSSVVALDATYDLSARWTVGGKYAWRRGELRASRDDSAEWFKGVSAQLAIARVDWKVVRNWSWDGGTAVLESQGTRRDRKTGWLTAGYYHVNENFKVGVGYNFTDYLGQPDRPELSQPRLLRECARESSDRPCAWTVARPAHRSGAATLLDLAGEALQPGGAAFLGILGARCRQRRVQLGEAGLVALPGRIHHEMPATLRSDPRRDARQGRAHAFEHLGAGIGERDAIDVVGRSMFEAVDDLEARRGVPGQEGGQFQEERACARRCSARRRPANTRSSAAPRCRHHVTSSRS